MKLIPSLDRGANVNVNVKENDGLILKTKASFERCASILTTVVNIAIIIVVNFTSHLPPRRRLVM